MKKARRPRTVCVRYQTQEVDRRNQAEALWSIGTFVEATIIVYGWFKPGTHDLWRPGEKVWVRSPMALLYRTMSIRMVTFTQDNEGGTRTTLDLVAPWQMNDESNAGATGVVPANPLNPLNQLNPPMPPMPPVQGFE